MLKEPPETIHPDAPDSKRCAPARLSPRKRSVSSIPLVVRNEPRPCKSGRNGTRFVRERVDNRRAGRRIVPLLLMSCLRLSLSRWIVQPPAMGEGGTVSVSVASPWHSHPGLGAVLDLWTESADSAKTPTIPR